MSGCTCQTSEEVEPDLDTVAAAVTTQITDAVIAAVMPRIDAALAAITAAVPSTAVDTTVPAPDSSVPADAVNTPPAEEKATTNWQDQIDSLKADIEEVKEVLIGMLVADASSELATVAVIDPAMVPV